MALYCACAVCPTCSCNVLAVSSDVPSVTTSATQTARVVWSLFLMLRFFVRVPERPSGSSGLFDGLTDVFGSTFFVIVFLRGGTVKLYFVTTCTGNHRAAPCRRYSFRHDGLVDMDRKNKKTSVPTVSFMWVLGVRREESEERSQERGVRSQELGVRSQESGVRSQESGVGLRPSVFS